MGFCLLYFNRAPGPHPRALSAQRPRIRSGRLSFTARPGPHPQARSGRSAPSHTLGAAFFHRSPGAPPPGSLRTLSALAYARGGFLSPLARGPTPRLAPDAQRPRYARGGFLSPLARGPTPRLAPDAQRPRIRSGRLSFTGSPGAPPPGSLRTLSALAYARGLAVLLFF